MNLSKQPVRNLQIWKSAIVVWNEPGRRSCLPVVQQARALLLLNSAIGRKHYEDIGGQHCYWNCDASKMIWKYEKVNDASEIEEKVNKWQANADDGQKAELISFFCSNKT